jgi:transcriptional regulator with XRE-family HTH domain
MSIDVGTHLKAVRQMYGLSQRELAKRAGVTNGLISLIEQNRVSPSVSSLKKVLDGIPMVLADFFSMDLGGQPQVFFPREELSDIGTASVELRLVGGRLDDVDAQLLALDTELRRISNEVNASSVLLNRPFTRALRDVTHSFAARTNIEPRLTLDGEMGLISGSQPNLKQNIECDALTQTCVYS